MNALGHSPPEDASKALQEQVGKIVGRLVHLARPRRARRAAGGGAARARACTALQLYSGGAEAVESALRLAKCHTGKYEFVSFWGGFHGKTMGALSLMGSTFKDEARPDGAGRPPDPVRRLLPLPAQALVPELRHRLRRGWRASRSRPRRPARSRRSSSSRCRARPATSSRPKEFLPAMRALADELGALLIADEMITGFGRTGRRWGVEHTGVRPDIVTIGKAFGGGFPLSGVLTTDEIVAGAALGRSLGLVVELRRQPAGRGGGRGGAADHRRGEAGRERARGRRVHPARAARAASSATRSSATSTARGCSCAIELVKDKKTKEPLATPRHRAHLHTSASSAAC